MSPLRALHVVSCILLLVGVGCRGSGRWESSSPIGTKHCGLEVDRPDSLLFARCWPETGARIHGVANVGGTFALFGDYDGPRRDGATWPFGPFSARLTPNGESWEVRELPQANASLELRLWVGVAGSGNGLFLKSSAANLPLLRVAGTAESVPLVDGIAQAIAFYAPIGDAERARISRERDAARADRRASDAERLSMELEQLEERLRVRDIPLTPRIALIAASSSGVALLVPLDHDTGALLKLSPTGRTEWGTLLTWSFRNRNTMIALDRRGDVYMFDAQYDAHFRRFTATSPLPVFDLDRQALCDRAKPYFCPNGSQNITLLGAEEGAVLVAPHGSFSNERDTIMARWFSPVGAMHTVDSSMLERPSQGAFRYALAPSGDVVASVVERTADVSVLTMCRIARRGERCTEVRSPERLHVFGLDATDDETRMLASLTGRSEQWSGEPSSMLVFARLRF